MKRRYLSATWEEATEMMVSIWERHGAVMDLQRSLNKTSPGVTRHGDHGEKEWEEPGEYLVLGNDPGDCPADKAVDGA
ncbi:hypothetical protein MLD38_004669 [Melastoma candidum]|uniref:Uncharacterized protein n=1 Tax=Melastoma candidum TaxID=119954 RepID=A0ACB9SF07_9MYRT|nr:hypothetical protein MLD38_004669 [Melastoma candidum]